MKLVDVNGMRTLERIAIEEYDVPSMILMENAAAGFVSALEAETGEVRHKKVHVFCGSGNNGGDGFAIARILSNRGASVCVTVLCETSRIAGDAKTNFEMVKHMQIPFVKTNACQDADIIIDAIFGTGFHGETEGAVKQAIDCMNQSGAYVAAVDIPSGISADTGKTAASAVRANLCVTFSALKVGQLLFPAKDYIEKIVKTDISVPQTVINDFDSGYDIIDRRAKAHIPVRRMDSHKGNFGKVLAFVGAKGMVGAAVLSAGAVLKSGAGMATAAVPEEIYPVVSARLTAVMTCSLEKDSAAQTLMEYAKTQDAVLIGCGIGKESWAVDTVRHMIANCEKPMVLDADGLNAVSQCPDVLKTKKAELILTPHIVEFSRLTGISPETIKQNPLEIAKEFSETFGVTLVLKDAVTVVATKDGRVSVSAGSNSGMATAGSGDVLSGIIAGLLAQGATSEKAAIAGVYIHLAAGSIARDRKGEYGMTAEDILNAVPEAFMQEIDIAPHIKEW